MMSNMQAFIERQPVISYYARAFAISWGGLLLLLVAPSGIPAPPNMSRGCSPSRSWRCSPDPASQASL